MFTGTSSSKKKAKLQAAESAVQALLGEPPDVVASAPVSATPTKMECEAEDSSPRGVNPTMVLNQLRPGTTYTAVVPDDPSESLGSNGKPLYGMFCVVDGERFEGCGTNKKMSKALAADAALRKLFGIQCAQMPGLLHQTVLLERYDTIWPVLRLTGRWAQCAATYRERKYCVWQRMCLVCVWYQRGGGIVLHWILEASLALWPPCLHVVKHNQQQI